MYDDEAQATEAYTHSHAQTMPSQICVAGGEDSAGRGAPSWALSLQGARRWALS